MEGLVSRSTTTEAEAFQHHLDQILAEVNRLEARVAKVERFYHVKNKMPLDVPKGSSLPRNGRQGMGSRKQHQVASAVEAAAAKRRQELMSQFATILDQITQDHDAWPFMHPVNAKRLGLDDYHEVIDKPMDFSTIETRMEAKDDSGYKNIREICADVRLIFENAMKYNDERNEVHLMAKNLLAKFEKKWRQLLPKVIDEERRREQEEAEIQLDLQLFKEVEHAKMVKNITNELTEVEIDLEELRGMVLQKCRKLTVFDKRQLLEDLHQLPLEDIMKAINIAAQSDPGFVNSTETMELDLTPENESAAWSLKFLVKNALEVQHKNLETAPTSDVDCSNESNKKSTNCQISAKKGKKDMCSAIVKSAKRRCTKPP